MGQSELSVVERYKKYKQNTYNAIKGSFFSLLWVILSAAWLIVQKIQITAPMLPFTIPVYTTGAAQLQMLPSLGLIKSNVTFNSPEVDLGIRIYYQSTLLKFFIECVCIKSELRVL